MKGAALESLKSSANIGPAIVPPLEARRKFGGFGRYTMENEERQKVRTPVVRNDEVLERLIEVWKSLTTYRCSRLRNPPTANNSMPLLEPQLPSRRVWGPCNIFSYHTKNPPIREYEQLLMNDEMIKGLCADDVEIFSLELKRFQNEEYFSFKAGIFLSALINYGKDNEYTVHTAHLTQPIHYLGNGNRRTITVKGDVAGWAGNDMEGGNLIIEGNGGIFLGEGLKSGEIIVMKTADDFVGHMIKGGRIIVKGKAGEDVGGDMTGGEIYLEDEYESLGKVKGGRIFHKGIQIAGVKLP